MRKGRLKALQYSLCSFYSFYVKQNTDVFLFFFNWFEVVGRSFVLLDVLFFLPLWFVGWFCTDGFCLDDAALRTVEDQCNNNLFFFLLLVGAVIKP